MLIFLIFATVSSDSDDSDSSIGFELLSSDYGLSFIMEENFQDEDESMNNRFK